MDSWPLLGDVLLLLLAAFVLGAAFARLRQSAILGYLLAGILLGPGALGLVAGHNEVALLSELGVALLLFSIGLEFSWRRLLASSRTALLGGALQVPASAVLAALAVGALGLDTGAAIAIGAAVALSSTAAVLRLLQERAELDGVHGRLALGILLVQDIALVPLVLLVHALGAGGTASDAVLGIGRALLLAAGVVGAFHLVARYLLPRLLGSNFAHANRELPLLFALIVAMGSAWFAHVLGISPSIGAFLAGMMLAESPYAVGIRADISALRTLFMTLFFSSIGMLADPLWMLQHAHWILAAATAIMGFKVLVGWGTLRVLGAPPRTALATGLCIAQMGEFAFVLLELARGATLAEPTFQLLISATLLTLFATPPLMALAGRLAWRPARKNSSGIPGEAVRREPAERARVLLVGFGPAGRELAVALETTRFELEVLELNPASRQQIAAHGLRAHLGDATRAEVLEHIEVAAMDAIVVALPDPRTAAEVVRQVRALAPGAAVVARARYSRHADLLRSAGAQTVVDEERQVGVQLAAALNEQLASH